MCLLGTNTKLEGEEIQKQKKMCVCSVQIGNNQEKKYKTEKMCVLGTNKKLGGKEIQKRKNVCVLGTNRKPSGEERA